MARMQLFDAVGWQPAAGFILALFTAAGCQPTASNSFILALLLLQVANLQRQIAAS